MPNYFGFDRLIAIPREPNEVFFTLDPSLYFSEKSDRGEDEQNRLNKDRLGKVDLMDASSEERIFAAKKDPPL